MLDTSANARLDTLVTSVMMTLMNVWTIHVVTSVKTHLDPTGATAILATSPILTMRRNVRTWTSVRSMAGALVMIRRNALTQKGLIAASAPRDPGCLTTELADQNVRKIAVTLVIKRGPVSAHQDTN